MRDAKAAGDLIREVDNDSFLLKEMDEHRRRVSRIHLAGVGSDPRHQIGWGEDDHTVVDALSSDALK